MTSWWRRLDWWDRTAHLLVALAAVYVVVSAAGWDPLGTMWPVPVLAMLAYMLVWSARTLRELGRMRRESARRQSEFEARLRELGGRS